MNGERTLNRREAESWRALAWLFDHGEAEWGICAELYGIRDPLLRRRMTTRLHAWFGPTTTPEMQPAWWPFNRTHNTPADRREGLLCRSLCCGFLAAMAAAGDPIVPEVSDG